MAHILCAVGYMHEDVLRYWLTDEEKLCHSACRLDSGSRICIVPTTKHKEKYQQQ